MQFKNNSGSIVDIIHLNSLPDGTPLFVGITYDLYKDRNGQDNAEARVDFYTELGCYCASELNLKGGVKPFPKTHIRSLVLPDEGKTLGDYTMPQPEEEEDNGSV